MLQQNLGGATNSPAVASSPLQGEQFKAIEEVHFLEGVVKVICGCVIAQSNGNYNVEFLSSEDDTMLLGETC